MKTHHKAAGMAALLALLVTNLAFAQVSEDGLGKVLPVEIWACTFNDGQDESDLDKVTVRWNKFLDDNGATGHAAWVLTPFHYTPEQDFDFLWMEAYADGNAMGSNTHLWITKGGDVSEDYNEVAA